MPKPKTSTRRKKVDVPAERQEDDVILDEKPIPEEFGTEQHTIVKKFKKRVPIEELEQEPFLLEEDDFEETSAPIAPPEEPDHVESFLAGIGGTDARWDMIVYRLPNYARDNRTDPVSRIRCGRMDFTEEYESEVQRRWARVSTSNHFIIVVKKNGKWYKQLPTFSCEPLTREEMIQSNADFPPTSPQAPIYLYPPADPVEPNGAPAPTAAVPRTFRQELKEFRDSVVLFREISGGEATATPAPPPAPAIDPEVATLQMLANNPTFMEKLSGGIFKKILGDAAIEPEPWYADMVKEALRTGQGPALIRTTIGSFFDGFKSLIPQPQNRGNNGTAPISPTQNETHNPEVPGNSGNGRNSQLRQGGLSETIPEQISQETPSDFPESEPGGSDADENADFESTEDEALRLVIEQCVQNIPVGVAAHRVIALANSIENQDPGHSIFPYLQLFCDMPIEGVLAFINSLPDGSEVTQLPHARQWTEDLQTALKQKLTEKGGSA